MAKRGGGGNKYEKRQYVFERWVVERAAEIIEAHVAAARLAEVERSGSEQLDSHFAATLTEDSSVARALRAQAQ